VTSQIHQLVQQEELPPVRRSRLAPLADYLEVDFEIQSTSMTLMSPWAERHQLGHVSRAELDNASNSHWNVVDEITMVVLRRQQSAEKPLPCNRRSMIRWCVRHDWPTLAFAVAPRYGEANGAGDF